MKITILGDPIPKQRPRFYKDRGLTKCFDRQGSIKGYIKMLMRREYQKGNREETILLGQAEAFKVCLYFYMPIPRSFNQGQKKHALWGIKRPTGKEDIDNLIKMYLDCGNGILYPDDHMIVELDPKEWYSETPRVEMEVTPIAQASKPIKDIFGIYGPPDISDLLDLLEEIKKTFKRYKYQQDYTSEELEQIAFLLSNLAKNHSSMLCKIKKINFKKSNPGHVL